MASDREPDISFANIQTARDLEQEYSKLMTYVRHVFITHWEITPDSADLMIDLLIDSTKAFAANYQKLCEAGIIPPKDRLKSLPNVKEVDL